MYYYIPFLILYIIYIHKHYHIYPLQIGHSTVQHCIFYVAFPDISAAVLQEGGLHCLTQSFLLDSLQPPYKLCVLFMAFTDLGPSGNP